MEIIIDKEVLLCLHGLALTEEEILDAAVLPDSIQELPDGAKEFYKKLDEKVLQLSVTVKDQKQILVHSAQWVENC